MRKWTLRILVTVTVLLAVGAFAVWRGWVTSPWPIPWISGQAEINTPPPMDGMENFIESVPVQRADTLIEDLQLAGKLTLRSVREVTAPFGEAIASLNVQVGDNIEAGQPLMLLNRNQLALDMDGAWLTLMTARQALVDLTTPSTELERQEAQTALLTAQEALTKLDEGPSPADIAAASLAIQEAQIAMTELLNRNDPNSDEVRQARFSLRQAENAVIDAQRAYDAISWRGGNEAAGQASALQGATLSLENAQREYDKAIAPPTEIEVQSAQLAIDQAQNAYNKLFAEVTESQIAQAQLQVAQAEQAIRELEDGPPEQEIQKAEAEVLKALTNFEEIRTNLQSGSAILAPINGIVTKVAVVEGQVVERGDTVATIAALDAFEVRLSVSEEYILRLAEQMPVDIRVSVSPDTQVSGIVTYISRIDTASFTQDQTTSFEASGNTPGTYPVTVLVTESEELESLRAGMNVQVTFVGSNQLPENSWLVPASSIEPTGDGNDTGIIQLLRNGTPEPLEVTVTNITQGEWQVVVSDELSEGDMVVGSVASFMADPFSGGMYGPVFR